MADVMARLRSLYALATHETTPVDEARTAALALLREAKKHGVTVSFRKEGAEAPRPSPPASASSRPEARTKEPFEDFFARRYGPSRSCVDCRLAAPMGGGPRCWACEHARRRREAAEGPPPAPPQCQRCRAPLPSDRVEYCTTCLEHRWQETRAKEPPMPQKAHDAQAAYDDLLRDMLRGHHPFAGNCVPFGDFSSAPRRRK